MSVKETHFCDICEREMHESEVDRGGVWFRGGQFGLPDVCDDCRSRKTLLEVAQIMEEKVRRIHGA